MKTPRKPARKAGKRAAAARTTRSKPASTPKAAKKASPIPNGYHTATPYLICRGAADAIEFYKKAFGAKEILRMPMPDGRLGHAEIQIGDSRVMLGDESPEMGARAPQTVGGTPVHIFLYLKDVDKTFAQAAAAGATVEMPPMDMFWGDRYCKVQDPFGHKWNMATHIEDLTPKEMARRTAEAMAKPQG
jgi:PhnB protein